MNANLRSGQILVLVLLVVVVILAIGLSVASRNLTNLRTSTQAEQSQRAFTAAEGGVEDVLSKLNSVANVIQSGTAANNCVQENSTTANCTIANSDTAVGGTVKVVAAKSFERTVEPGDVAQLNLQGYPAGQNITISWIKSSADPAFSTLEFIFICGNDASTTCGADYGTSTDTSVKVTNQYGQHRDAFSPGGSPPTGSQAGVSNCSAGTGFTCQLTFSLVGSNVRILRLKPYWNRTTINVSPANLSSFPVQSYEITSTATTDTGVTRKVEVRRDALPNLPAIFDFVLYSGGDIVK